MAADARDSCSSPPPGSQETRLYLFLISILLVGLTGVTFREVSSFDFLIWDDEFFLLPHLRREGGITPSSVAWSFQPQQGWFTPLPYLSLFLDATFYDLNSAGFHVTNLMIHMANVLLVLLVLYRLTRNLWPSCLAAAIFAVHPIHVEPVVWLTARWELLMGTFWLLGMWAYTRYCESRTWASYSLVAVFYCAALLSKPMALTFPFALLLLDVWPLRRLAMVQGQTDQSANQRLPAVTWYRAVVEKLPLFAIMFAFLGVAWRAKSNFLASKNFVEFTATEKFLNSLETYAIYAGQFAWPTPLSFFYPHPSIGAGFHWWSVCLCFSVLAAITLIAIALFSRRPYLIVGWLWYLGVLVPVNGWVQVEQHARADRYMYVPLIGLCMILCWSAWEASHVVRYGRVVRGVLAVGVVLAFAFCSRQQASHWHDSQTLMEYGVEIDPRNYKAQFNLGHLAIRQQNFTVAENYYRAGLAVYESGRGHYLVGRSLYLQDRLDEACDSLRESLQLNQSYVPAHGLLARCLLQQERTVEADQQYTAMLQANPDSALANIWYAEHRARHGDYYQAADYYRNALNLEPNAELVVVLLGEALEKAGQYKAATRHYEEQFAARPRQVNLANRLAWLLATHPNPEARDGPKAVRLASRLAKLSSFRNRFVLDTLAATYAEASSFSQAIETVDQAVNLAKEEKDKAHLKELQERRQLYYRKQPYRDTQRFPTRDHTLER